MKLLTFDIETKDPYIGRGLGAGYVYKINCIAGCDYELLGIAYRTHNGTKGYTLDWDFFQDLIDSHDVLIGHNISYDLGGVAAYGMKVKDKPVYDTEIMSRLYNSSLMSHSLDACAKLYVRGSKNNNALTDAIVKNDIYPYLKREEVAKAKAIKNGEEWIRERPPEAKLVKWAKENMKLIQDTDFQSMKDYAIGDIDATWDVFQYLIKKVGSELALKYSKLAHICIQYRIKGVRVDIDRAREIRNEMIPLIAEKYKEVYRIAGKEFNISSIKEVPDVFDSLGIDYPKSEKGNPSITSPWMMQQDHPICKAIISARKALKIDRDFIQNIILQQEFTCPDAGRYGRVYPELHLMRARTGRFSCTNPNLQQIPSRDPVYGPLCRSMFVPEEGEKWYSLDYSNQEGRLQVHYAYLLKCEGAVELRNAFIANPNLDMHSMVAKMAHITRTEAKTVNLGLSYGMGIKTLTKSLQCSEKDAIVVREKYNKLAPFLKQLNEKCQETAKRRGSIKTLGGRLSRIDAPILEGKRIRTFEYKALNKLIQGSAADQTIAAMVKAYEEGIPVMLPIHDELVMSGSRDQALRLKTIMEEAAPLEIPVVVSMGNGGNNWNEGDH